LQLQSREERKGCLCAHGALVVGKFQKKQDAVNPQRTRRFCFATTKPRRAQRFLFKAFHALKYYPVGNETPLAYFQATKPNDMEENDSGFASFSKRSY